MTEVKKRSRRRWALGLVGVGLIMGATEWASGNGYGCGYNYSPSVPRGVYWRSPARDMTIEKGTLVCLDTEQERVQTAFRRRGFIWNSKDALLKRVVAVTGDRLERTVEGLLIVVEPSGRRVTLSESRAKPVDPMGRRLVPPAMPKVLEEGEVWLAGDGENSVDSRYFGAVRTEWLTCRATPVWTF